MVKFTFFSVIFCLFCTVSLKSQTNLLTNGNFESVIDDTPEGWAFTISNVATWELVDEAAPTTGLTKALKVTAEAANKQVLLKYEFTGLDYDTEYELTFWFKTVVAPPANATINYLTGYRPGLFVNPKYDQKRMKSTGTPSSRGYRAAINSGTVNDDGVYSDYFSYVEGEWDIAFVTFTTPALLVQADCPADGEYHYTLDSGNGQIEIQVQNSTIIIDDVQVVKVSDVITGINSVEEQPLLVRVESGNVIVRNAEAGSRIDVYSLVGNRLQSVLAAQGETVLSGLPKGQVLIVRNGNKVAKVVVK
jgi:hypothetical protein